MTLREYLMTASKSAKLIQSKTEQLRELRLLSVTAKSFANHADKNPSKRASQVERTVMKIMKLEEKINGEISDYINLLADIYELLSYLGDAELRNIMERHYINRDTWEKISADCYISLRHVYNLRNKALTVLEPVYDSAKRGLRLTGNR